MDTWKKSFTEKLGRVQSSWVTCFNGALDEAVVPVFGELSNFLRDNGFATSTPLNESGRRSYKFELAEDAYLLLIFRSAGMGQFTLSCESVVPGGAPHRRQITGRIAELNVAWAREQMQKALDGFIDLLDASGSPPPRVPEEEEELTPA
jgi:hypothetical protein